MCTIEIPFLGYSSIVHLDDGVCYALNAYARQANETTDVIDFFLLLPIFPYEMRRIF